MKKVKKAAGIVVFCLLLVFAYYVADTTLKFKYEDGIRPMMDFYNYPDNSIDVLFIGSSHIGINIDTDILCNDYGIAAYKLWGHTQPTWNSYFYLVEALKTQTPKVVVMETLSLTHDIEYQGYAESLKNTLGLKWSLNRINAIITSVAPENRISALLSFPTYHSRYSSLTDVDYQTYFWNYQFVGKNTKDWYAVYVGEEPYETDQRREMGQKEKLYLEKIIALCEKNNIPILFVSTPYSASEDEEDEIERLNTVRDWIAENGYDYLDYIENYKEIGIDFSTDFGDSAGHLNTYGITKLTDAVGSYLRENYDLPERYYDPYFSYELPGDAAYALIEPFEGDGAADFVDTGIKLYDDPDKNWTVLAKIDPQCDSDEKIFFSCFSEEEPYRGLLVRGNAEGGLDVIVGSNYYIKVELDTSGNATLAIQKDGDGYAIYCNGELVASEIETSCDAYEGTLTIGSQWLANGTLGKLSKVYVESLEVREEALGEEEIIEWMEQSEEPVTVEEIEENYRENYTGDLTYTLAEPFEGDGAAYLDTGVQLCYDTERDWTLLAELEVPSDEETGGVYISCFAEDTENYRGILVRKADNMLQVLVGNGQTLQRLLLSDANVRVAVTKQGNTYEVFVNGVSLGTVESEMASYIAPLLLGAEFDENYEVFRQSNLTVQRLEIQESVLSVEEIAQW